MIFARAGAALAAGLVGLGWTQTVEAGRRPDFVGGGPVELCHCSPDNPNDCRTMRLPLQAAIQHLAHGDRFGPCGNPPCTQLDGDGDGVNDCADQCAATPAGDLVDAQGCSLVILVVNAGPDHSVLEGEDLSVNASVEVVQGDVDVNALVWSWQQTAGDPVPFSHAGPDFSFATFGFVGNYAFRVTVSVANGQGQVSDDLLVEVLEPKVVQVSAGRLHNVALFEDSHIVTWGYNLHGQLGDGSLTTDIADTSASALHTVLATLEGDVFVFGDDLFNSSATPVQIPGIGDVVRVAAFARGALMLQSTGVLYGFAGSTGSCVLGGASPTTPTGGVNVVQVQGAPTNLVDVAVGFGHVVALDAAGTAWIWGSRFGCTPRSIMGNVVAIAAGYTDSVYFVRADGTAWGLGYNFHGQLGNGHTLSNYSVPTQVVDLTNVVGVSAGDRHTLFLTGDGSLYASGWNRYCQLGLEDEVNPATPQFGVNVLRPTQVSLADVVTITGGETHSLAVTGDGSVYVWGLNNSGQLHLNSFTTLPGQVCMPMEVELE